MPIVFYPDSLIFCGHRIRPYPSGQGVKISLNKVNVLIIDHSKKKRILIQEYLQHGTGKMAFLDLLS